MTIGIGVTTYNRPEHLKVFKEQIKKYSLPHLLYIAEDNPRIGIAKRKNECLRALRDMDYIFIFDDDCFPICNGWDQLFIDHFLKSGQHHFLYLKQTTTLKMLKEENNLEYYDNCGGCFMFLTKEVIKKVGGYHDGYGIYGYEHAGYSQRIHMAKLTTHPYISITGSDKYIYAMDYDFYLPFNKRLNHKSSLSNEIEKIPGYIEHNKKIYDIDQMKIYHPL